MISDDLAMGGTGLYIQSLYPVQVCTPTTVRYGTVRFILYALYSYPMRYGCILKLVRKYPTKGVHPPTSVVSKFPIRKRSLQYA